MSKPEWCLVYTMYKPTCDGGNEEWGIGLKATPTDIPAALAEAKVMWKEIKSKHSVGGPKVVLQISLKE